MNLIFVGCEYAGKSTIAAEVMKWAERTLGGSSHFHDHMSVPSSELIAEAPRIFVDPPSPSFRNAPTIYDRVSHLGGFL